MGINQHVHNHRIKYKGHMNPCFSLYDKTKWRFDSTQLAWDGEKEWLPTGGLRSMPISSQTATTTLPISVFVITPDNFYSTLAGGRLILLILYYKKIIYHLHSNRTPGKSWNKQNHHKTMASKLVLYILCSFMFKCMSYFTNSKKTFSRGG